MTTRCGDCAHFTDDYPEIRKTDEERDPDTGALGGCAAASEIVLPHSMRYCKRETMGVWSLEVHEKPCLLFVAAV